MDGTGQELNRSESNWAGSGSVYMEPLGTGPGVRNGFGGRGGGGYSLK